MAIVINTSQNVELNMKPAGLGDRILASIIDLLIIAIWTIGLLSTALSISFSSEDHFFLYTIALLPAIFYDLLFEIFNNGQSIGKMALKIRVVNLDGTTPSNISYFIRWVFRLIDFSLTFYALGIIMIIFTKNSQRLGDLLARTTVISLKTNTSQPSHFILDFEDDYRVMYPDLLEKLNDQDIAIINKCLNGSQNHPQNALADKIKEVTGYTYSGNNKDFLKQIIQDYSYLSLQ